MLPQMYTFCGHYCVHINEVWIDTFCTEYPTVYMFGLDLSFWFDYVHNNP